MKTFPARNSLPDAMGPIHEILQQELREFPSGFVQSMAFFRTPAMPQSYSGVANRDGIGGANLLLEFDHDGRIFRGECVVGRFLFLRCVPSSIRRREFRRSFLETPGAGWMTNREPISR
jgi:hypothetical protein